MDPASELQTVYANRFSAIEQRRKLVWQVLAREFFQKWVAPSDSVLDIGAGYCEFINNIVARQKTAIDLNPTTVSAANKDVSVISQDVTAPWQINANSINVAFSSNFLEHLPSKEAVLNCLREAHRVLAPGGTLILLGPNIRFCGDVYWDFFDHHVPLSDRSIVEALQLTGFEVTQATDRFLPFSMQGRMPTHPILVSIYLRLTPAWKIFGQQFLVVARRP